ncbi:MAG: hypothetical protein AB8C40_06305 [Gammaproteobacteria bacterium]
MKHKNVYEMSRKYAPPKINLRDAEIMDSFGDESHAKRAIKHLLPTDVSREDFDYYGWVYPFMEFKDLLFYFYPIADEYEKDKELDCVDSFMYSLDRELPIGKLELDHNDVLAIKEGLHWIWESGGEGYADWWQCPNLQQEIGITVE